MPKSGRPVRGGVGEGRIGACVVFHVQSFDAVGLLQSVGNHRHSAGLHDTGSTRDYVVEKNVNHFILSPQCGIIRCGMEGLGRRNGLISVRVSCAMQGRSAEIKFLLDTDYVQRGRPLVLLCGSTRHDLVTCALFFSNLGLTSNAFLPPRSAATTMSTRRGTWIFMVSPCT